MLSIPDIQNLIADSFFGGSDVLAGLVMLGAILGVVLALFRNKYAALIVALPVILMFSILGVLSVDIMILLIIITVCGLAFVARDASWRDCRVVGRRRQSFLLQDDRFCDGDHVSVPDRFIDLHGHRFGGQ